MVKRLAYVPEHAIKVLCVSCVMRDIYTLHKTEHYSILLAHTHPQNPSFIQMVLLGYITAILEQHTYTML